MRALNRPLVNDDRVATVERGREGAATAASNPGVVPPKRRIAGWISLSLSVSVSFFPLELFYSCQPRAATKSTAPRAMMRERSRLLFLLFTHNNEEKNPSAVSFSAHFVRPPSPGFKIKTILSSFSFFHSASSFITLIPTRPHLAFPPRLHLLHVPATDAPPASAGCTKARAQNQMQVCFLSVNLLYQKYALPKTNKHAQRAFVLLQSSYFAFFTNTYLFPTEDWPTWTFSPSLTPNALSS